MARKGKQPIPIPKGVEVKVQDLEVSVKGPKGLLSQKIQPFIVVKVEDEQVLVSLADNARNKDHFHGLYRTLIENLVIGVSQGFEKKLEMIGVGYRANVQGNQVDVQVGLSHPSKIDIPTDIEVKIEKGTQITISGPDKQKVGQLAANIRSMRPPEPYQGKGIRYAGEYVRKKAGKSASKK